MGNGNSNLRSKSGNSKVAPAKSRRRSSCLKWSFRRKSSQLKSKTKEENESATVNSSNKDKSKLSTIDHEPDINRVRVSSFSSDSNANNEDNGRSTSSSTSHRKINTNQHIPNECLITVHDFYNLLNDGSFTAYIHDPGNMLLIDARDERSFLQLHVITATHHSECEIDSFNILMFSMVIIYGNSINNNEASELLRLKERFSNEIAEDVLVLKEGFDVFSKIYPFMCTERIISVWERRGIATYPSVILEGKLYQGKGDHAKSENVIRNLKITHVLNITTEHKNAFEDKLVYLRLTIEDESSSNLFTHLKQTTTFIESALDKGGCVLVHCNLGVSRSSTATLAYLIKNKKWTLSDAYTYLKSRRSCIRPNIGFLKQLSNWEASILGRKLTDIDSL